MNFEDIKPTVYTQKSIDKEWLNSKRIFLRADFNVVYTQDTDTKEWNVAPNSYKRILETVPTLK